MKPLWKSEDNETGEIREVNDFDAYRAFTKLHYNADGSSHSETVFVPKAQQNNGVVDSYSQQSEIIATNQANDGSGLLDWLFKKFFG